MRPVQTRVSSLKLLGEYNHIAKVGVGYQRDAPNPYKVFSRGQCDAHPVPGVGAVSEKIFALHRVYAEVLDSELLIGRKNVVLGGGEKGLGGAGEEKPILTVGPADDRAPVLQMRPEKHYIAAVLLDDTGIVDCGHRVGDIRFGENGIFFITFYNGSLSRHRLFRCSSLFKNGFIDPNIFFNHTIDSEVLFNTAATAGSINIFYMSHSIDGLIHRGNQKTGFAVFDQFRHAPPVKGDYGGAAGHGFDNGQSERLIEIDGMEKRVGLFKQQVSLNRPDAADIDRTLFVQVRFDVLVMVRFILNDSGHDQLFIAGPGNFKSLSGSLVRVNATEKEEIIIRFRLKIKLLQIYAVMDGFDIVKIRRPVGIADGNIKYLVVIFFINRQNPWR